MTKIVVVLDARTPLYRYVHKNGAHFYTTRLDEIGTGTCPLYRYNGSDQHFYTVDPCEIGVVKPGMVGLSGYQLEGIAGYVMTTYPCETATC